MTSSFGRIVGRDREVSELRSFLGGRPDRPSALLLDGEAGIGKTTVVRAAVEWATSADLSVFEARPAAGEAELPYVGLGDLLATVDDDALQALAAPQRSALAAAVGREGSSGAVDEHALSRGLLELLRLEAAAGDLLVVVDDVQ